MSARRDWMSSAPCKLRELRSSWETPAWTRAGIDSSSASRSLMNMKRKRHIFEEIVRQGVISLVPAS